MNDKLTLIEEAYIELQTRLISEQENLSEEEMEELYESLSSYKKAYKLLNKKYIDSAFKTSHLSVQSKKLNKELTELPKKHGIKRFRADAVHSGQLAGFAKRIGKDKEFKDIKLRGQSKKGLSKKSFINHVKDQGLKHTLYDKIIGNF